MSWRPGARAAALWLLAAAPSAAGAQPLQEVGEAPKPAATRDLPAIPASLSLAIEFEARSARLRPASGPALGQLVAALLAPELQNSRFVIEGHGEPGASAQANRLLSQQRADEVRLYLVALGVPASRLRAVGKGGDGAETPMAPYGRVRVVALD
jgi:OOP family OmpA-OmpF porin